MRFAHFVLICLLIAALAATVSAEVFELNGRQRLVVLAITLIATIATIRGTDRGR